MDINITKKRLNNHLSYDWWKYLAIVVAAVFFWSLVMTMIAPRLHYGKKLEVFLFLSNSYEAANAEKLHGNLLEAYKETDTIEVYLNHYAPDASGTSEIISTRMATQEGDFYAFGTSGDPASNLYGYYVDQGLYVDFDTLIADAKAYYDDRQTEETFRAENGKKYNTDAKMLAAYAEYEAPRKRANDYARRLEGYIYNDNRTRYANLFYRYARYSVTNGLPEEMSGGEKITEEEEKIWGLDLSAFTPDGTNSFVNSGKIGIFGGELTAAIGMMGGAFKEKNMPYFYDNILFITYLIETYYIGLLPAQK
jgi:hypothetical protein